MFECPACLSEFRKLRELSCSHRFCQECLEKIAEDGKLSCPTCKQEVILPPFGVKQLDIQYSGTVHCAGCKDPADFCECFWCATCQDLFCRSCKESQDHATHDTSEKGHVGPVNYSIKVIEKYAELHTNLCQMQKGIVQEYFMKVQQSILKMLDTDLHARLDKFKTEKKNLEEEFQQPFQSVADSADFRLNGNKYVNYLRKLQEIADMQNCRRPSELAASTGILFKPPHVDKLVEDLIDKQGNIVGGSSISYRQLMPVSDTKMPVAMFVGAGILTHPCDLAFIPKNQSVIVTSSNSGILALKTSSTEVISRAPAKKNQQFVCVDPCKSTGKLFVSCLEDQKLWKIRVFKDATCQEGLESFDCPDQPKVGPAWYRWITVLSEKFLILSFGDKDSSGLHLYNLETKEWTLIHEETGSTYRRAGFRALGPHTTMLYVPDMQKVRIRTFTLNTESGELTGFAQISYDELDKGIPVSIDISGEMLVIGLWVTGNIVLADLNKGSSKTLACVGPRELLSIRITDDRLFALRKKLEVVEVYNFSKFQ